MDGPRQRALHEHAHSNLHGTLPIVRGVHPCRITPLYRGPGGVTPKSFWEPDTYGCTGGVEMALMSCSKSKEEALRYVRRSKAKLLFEVHQGMAARGAEISWLSQYPHEAEILFAPLTGMEVRGSRVEGSVQIYEVALTVNMASLTIEQVVARPLTLE